jgi:hypothetical protein
MACPGKYFNSKALLYRLRLCFNAENEALKKHAMENKAYLQAVK